MKKHFLWALTLALLALFPYQNVLATVDTSKMYRLKNTVNTNYLTFSNTSATEYNVAGMTVATLDESSDAQIFVFEEATDGKYYIKSRSGYYILCEWWQCHASTSSKTQFTVTESNGNYSLYQAEAMDGTTTRYGYIAPQATGAVNVYCNNDQGSTYELWTLEEVSLDDIPYCEYTGNATGTKDRYLSYFTITDDNSNSVAVTDIQSSKTDVIYHDKTSLILTTNPGATLSFSETNGVSWMHGYVYIDYNNSRTFDQVVNYDGTTGGELVSYNYYSSSSSATSSTNIKGETVAYGLGVSASTMPSWTLPTEIDPGDYRLRFKVDWNSLDPCGGSTIASDNGAMVDITLRIVNPTVTVTAVAGIGGTVAITGGTNGSITVNSGASVTLTASANDGYVFVSWTNSAGDVVSTNAQYTFNATTTDTYTANFAEKLSVSIVSNDTNMGTVAFEDGTTETKYVGANGTVTVVATPATPAYKFVSWSNGVTTPEQTITVTQDLELTATFAAKATPAVSITSENGTLALTVNGASAEIGTTLYEGDVIALTATPATGYKFVKWSVNGADAGTDATYTTTIGTEALTITPVFEALKQFTINIEQPTGGTITVVNAEGNNITSAYEGEYITVAISVESAYRLDGLYINDAQQGLDANNSISVPLAETLDSDINIRAELTRLTAEELYTAMGKPTYTSTANVKYSAGAEILAGAIGAIAATVDMSSVPSMTTGNYAKQGVTDPIYVSTGATFNLKLNIYWNAWYGMQFYLLHNTTDEILDSYGYFGKTGSWDTDEFWSEATADTRLTVDTDAATIVFPITLPETVKVGDIVVLRAMGTNNETVSPTGTYGEGSYVDYLFHVVEAEVTATASPEEGGTVTVSPSEEDIKIGTEVTLTAEPKEGYAFANWTDANGASVGTGLTYTFSATKENTYTANFAQSLTVSIASNNSAMGTVNFSGEETSVTQKEVVSGTQVTVVATPAVGYKFVEWSNGSTDATQTVTITEDITLTATFEAKTEYTVTVTEVEGGSVTYTVGGEEVDKIYEGDEVTFTATPATGYEFVRWTDEEGNPLSTANPYIVTANADITIIPVYGEVPVEKDLFNTSEVTLDDYNNGTKYPHRIPGIAKTSTGRLIATAARLVCGTDPGYGQVDVVCRTSDDNGETWSEIKDVAVGTGETSATENYFDTAFGDPAIVADSESKNVIIIAVAGCTLYTSEYTTRENPNLIALIRSTDNGETWQEPIDITENIYSLFDDGNQLQAAFVAGGRIFQSRIVKVGDYYRIYAAMCARPNGNRVIYSDDFGSTWHALGGEFALPIPAGDEPKCEELPDGRVIVSSRMSGGRYYNIYTYTNTATAKGSWGSVATSDFSASGTTPGANSTNGEIMVVPVVRNSDGEEMYLALQSLPTGSTRTNVGIFYKELTEFTDYSTVTNFASGWDGYYEVTTEESAYSSMDLQADNKIAFIYEKDLTSIGTANNPTSTSFPTGSGTHNIDGFDNIYVSYNLEYITNGAYSIKNSVNRGTIVSDYLTTLVAESSVEDDVKAELNEKISGFGDNPTPAQVDAIYSVLYADPWDGQVVTFTNKQYSGNTHVIYENESGVLSLSANGVTAESLGASAQFLCEKRADDIYSFKNLSSGNYMIYRNNDDADNDAKGANDNKGTLADYDATYCNWTVSDGSGTVAGTYYMSAGRPSTSSPSSCQIVLSTGVFDGWSSHEVAYASGYSNLYAIEVVEFEGIEELIATGQSIISETGVGYPASEASTREDLNQAIANASNNPNAATGVALQNAINAYYAETSVKLPSAGTIYSFIVGHDTKYYIYNNEGTLSLAAYTEGETELPETAKFTCEVSEVSGVTYYMFRTSDNKYMAFPSFGSENYSDASADGIEDTASDLTRFSVAKLYNNINANVTETNTDLFGKVYLTVLLRGHKNDGGTAESGVYVVKTTDGSWDGSSTPFDNGTYSSAISIIEVNDVPERTITVKVNPENAATITINGDVATEVTAEGAITLVATPASGYGFKNWTDESGTVVSTDATLVDNTEGNKTYTANLVVGYSVTAEVKEGQESYGTVEVQGGVDGVFGEGSEATLIAKPASGYVFKQWTLDGYAISTKSTYTTVIMKNENYVAEFEKGYIEMTLHYLISNGATTEERSNRYLASVTAVADKGGENELTTTVFEATTEAGLPRIDAEATAFAANSEDGYTTIPTTTGALIDKTGNSIKVIKGTTTLDLTFKAWLESMLVRGYTANPELNQTQQAIYVDWNNDQDFEGDEIYGIAEDTYPNDAYTSEDGYTRQITIPSGVEAGSYRMRVIYFDPVEAGLTDWATAIVDETIDENNDLIVYRDINQGRAYDFTIQVVEDANYITFDDPGDTYYTVGDKVEVTLTYPVEGATIYYTVDGTDPDLYAPTLTSGGTVALNTYEEGDVVVKAMAVADGVESEIFGATYHIAIKDLATTIVASSAEATTITAAEISNGTGVTNGAIDHTFYQGQQEATDPIMVTASATFNLDLTIDLNNYGITVYKGEILSSGSKWGLLYNYIGSTEASLNKDDFVADLTSKGLEYTVVDETNAIYKVSMPINMATAGITAETFKQSESLVYRVIVSSEENKTSVTTDDFGTGEYVDFVFTVAPKTEEIKFYGQAGKEVSVSVTTVDGGYVSLGGVTANLTSTESTQVTTTMNAAGEFTIQAVGGEIASVAIEALDCETEILIPQSDVIKSITLKSDVDFNAATVDPVSDLSQGVQVVVEKEIKTPQPVEGNGTPTIFNFLSMPFSFNTADIKYWDGDSWEAAEPENHVRILLYNSQTRANQDYKNTWETITTTTHKTVAANQGFVIVGNNDLGTTVKLQFTSAAAAYDGSVTSVTANRYRKIESDTEVETIIEDKDWNFNGVPYLTAGEFAGDYTLYTYDNSTLSYVSHTPAEGLTLKPYQAVMYQAEIEGANLTKDIAINTASISNANATDDVYARAYISIDDATPAKIILSEETSENFVVNEDAWYIPSLINTTPAAYFNIEGADASVSVQPSANELPMTVYTGAGTSHRISLASTDGNYNVYLKDAVTDETVCLNDEDYTFTATAKTTIANRFTVSMLEPTGITESAADATLKAVVIDNTIKIYGTEQGEEIALYTANGMIITNAVAEEGVTTIETTATGVIIIKVAEETLKVVK